MIKPILRARQTERLRLGAYLLFAGKEYKGDYILISIQILFMEWHVSIGLAFGYPGE